MHHHIKAIWVLAILACTAPAATAKPKAAPEEDRGTVVITFKDGHQQTFRLADIARIEFNNTTTALSASAPGRARFLGAWKVGIGGDNTGTFIITLKADGVAHKTIGSHNGTWAFVNGEARINWDDGWHDCIRKFGNRYEKAAYSPGTTFSDSPASVADAVYTEPN